jgi:hypothetical protein
MRRIVSYEGTAPQPDRVLCLAWNRHRERDRHRAALGSSEEAVLWARSPRPDGAIEWTLVTIGRWLQPGHGWVPQTVTDAPSPGRVTFRAPPTEADVRALLAVDPMYGSHLELLASGIDDRAWREAFGTEPGRWLSEALGRTR